MTADLTEEQTAAMQRLLSYMPREDDLTLLVLKGHLLIEERLYKIVTDKVRHAPAIEHARLNFWQLALVAKALTYKPEYDWLWSSLKKLNKLRNQFAHNLEPAKVQELIEGFVRHLETQELPLQSDRTDLASRLRYGIAFTYGALAVLPQAKG